MDMQWACNGDVVGVPWECSGNVMEVQWERDERVMDVVGVRYRSGCCPGEFVGCFQVRLFPSSSWVAKPGRGARPGYVRRFPSACWAPMPGYH